MNRIRRSILAAGAVVLTAFGTNTSKADDIVDMAANAGNLNTLVAALERANLVETLKWPNKSFTVFAPTDEAFANLPAGTIENLNEDQLRAVLTYHVLPGWVRTYDLEGKKQYLETVQGSKVAARAFNDVHVDEAKVISSDIIATNGVIHVIDQVIMPPQ
ncbi:MAG: fasciclin domain-containing protein [Kiloniellales bacterium]|nr:fasciclin domain-containing protein [Kiloniellales bacterium]